MTWMLFILHPKCARKKCWTSALESFCACCWLQFVCVIKCSFLRCTSACVCVCVWSVNVHLRTPRERCHRASVEISVEFCILSKQTKNEPRESLQTSTRQRIVCARPTHTRSNKRFLFGRIKRLKRKVQVPWLLAPYISLRVNVFKPAKSIGNKFYLFPPYNFYSLSVMIVVIPPLHWPPSIMRCRCSARSLL